MISFESVHSIPRRLIFVVAGMLLLASSGPRGAAVQDGAFDQYARGDFTVIEGLTVDRFEQIRREVKASGLPGRLKAAFFLEAFETFQRRLQLDFPARDARLVTFQDGYEILTSGPETAEFEASWFSAAAAALAYGWPGQYQYEVYWRQTVPNRLIERIAAHVPPGELALTRALPIEWFAWRTLYQERGTFVTAEKEAAGNTFGKPLLDDLLDWEKNAIRRALVGLKKAERLEAVRPESLMRQAALLAASGQPKQAIPLFEESETLGRDDWVMYLDHLLEGRALETLDRPKDAEASYRAALALRPKARSANLALSALLFAHGTRADSNLLAAFDPASDRFDPWAQFTYGAYRFWPERRDAMRRLLK